MRWRSCRRIGWLLSISAIFWAAFVFVPSPIVQSIAKPFALASVNHMMLELFTIAVLEFVKSPRLVKIFTFSSELIVVLIWLIAALTEVHAVMQIFGWEFVFQMIRCLKNIC